MNSRRRLLALICGCGWSAAASAQATPGLAAALARAQALRDEAVRSGDQPYGAVVIDAAGRIVGEAPSRVVVLGNADAHAEREALRDALGKLGRGDLGGLLLVSSSRPCSLCEAAAARAGIARMFHGSGTDAGKPRAPDSITTAATGSVAAAQATPPLVAAAARGDLQAVRRLLLGGAAINERDQRGRNAVLAATQGAHADVARALIERGADVNAQDEIEDSAFLLAGARGLSEIVRLALPTADFGRTNRYGGTALIPACHYGHVETVRVLLASAVDIDHVNRLGWTALLEAVILGDGGAAHTEIVRLLVAHGARLDLADRDGVTPLQHALRRGQAALARILREAGGR